MSGPLQWANELKAEGKRLGREGMSLRVIAAVEQFDGSYKGAMKLAGRLKAISQMASADGYWREKVEDGYHLERQQVSARGFSNAEQAGEVGSPPTASPVTNSNSLPPKAHPSHKGSDSRTGQHPLRPSGNHQNASVGDV